MDPIDHASHLPLLRLLLQDLTDVAVDRRSRCQSRNTVVPPPPSRLAVNYFLW
jgi:hypothetical protein